MPNKRLREIPAVDEVLKSAKMQECARSYSKNLITQAVRDILTKMRADIIAGQKTDISLDTIEKLVISHIEDILKPSIKKIINASGTILHTNLGRAILCDSAVEAVKICAGHPVNLEFDIGRGERGERDSHIEDIICRLTGAEAATVVNNNAAAVFLALNTLAEDREVIISRGELIEIGGSFRIPEVIQKSGCKLIEVGTTNRTHLSDYTSAISPDTAAILKVHTSNYRVVGFTASVDMRELAAIGSRYAIPVIEDLGSGSLVDLSQFGLPKEPVVRDSVETGIDIVTFSGDKLLGGPQAGIIIGRRKYIQKINKNPLKRALRVDKITIAALEATLKLYLNPDTLHRELPTLRFLTRPIAEIMLVAEKAARLLKQRFVHEYIVTIEDGESQIGSGSLPDEVIPTKVISITHKEILPEKIFEMFLKNEPPILGRIHNEKFLLDMRIIENAQEVVIGD